jgi:hypothetical protein
MEEHFYVAEHSFNVNAVKVKRLCDEIVDMEDRLEALYAELKTATDIMMRPKREGRIRRVRKPTG